MKKLISVLCALTLVSAVAIAQPNNKKKGADQWREKVRAEQVAFITNELNLTEAEAQAFWPVYNDVQNKRREAFKASGEAFKALSEGIDGDDVNKLLDQRGSSTRRAGFVLEVPQTGCSSARFRARGLIIRGKMCNFVDNITYHHG